MEGQADRPAGPARGHDCAQKLHRRGALGQRHRAGSAITLRCRQRRATNVRAQTRRCLTSQSKTGLTGSFGGYDAPHLAATLATCSATQRSSSSWQRVASGDAGSAGFSKRPAVPGTGGSAGGGGGSGGVAACSCFDRAVHSRMIVPMSTGVMLCSMTTWHCDSGSDDIDRYHAERTTSWVRKIWRRSAIWVKSARSCGPHQRWHFALLAEPVPPALSRATLPPLRWLEPDGRSAFRVSDMLTRAGLHTSSAISRTRCMGSTSGRLSTVAKSAVRL